MDMRKGFALLVSLAMLVCVAGCGSQSAVKSQTGTEAVTEAVDYSNSTLVGKVLSIDGTTITLQLGELTVPEGFGGANDSDSQGTAPEIPSDNGSADGTPPDMPAMMGAAFTAGDETASIDLGDAAVALASGEDGSASDVAVGDVLTVTIGNENAILTVTVEPIGGGMSGEMPNGAAMGGTAPGGEAAGGSSSGVDSYEAANTYGMDTTLSGIALSSAGTDENAVLVTDGANVTLDHAVITRDSDDSTGGDQSSFYGVGAAALVTSGVLTITDSTIASDASGGAGVFAYGTGTAYVSDTAITTRQGTSGGIHVAGGGTLYAWNLTVETDGASSAAIRSDRGSGTIVVDGGSYTSNGSGSPAVYSTADISIHDAVLTATGAEAICIEGLNTIRLFDCDLSGNMPDDNSQNDCVWNVILYQSMSGDAEEGNSTFEMIGGSLTAASGGMFYTTNTESTFLLSDVAITYAASNAFFLKCTGNSNARGWGSAGSNGADCHFTAVKQVMQGDVIWDSISQLDLYVLEGSVLTGAVLNDESNAGDGGNGYAALYIDQSSTWTVTGDSTLTKLCCEGVIVDENGNTVSVVGSDGTVYVEGTSAYTITVESFESSVDVSGASSPDSWEDFAVTKE